MPIQPNEPKQIIKHKMKNITNFLFLNILRTPTFNGTSSSISIPCFCRIKRSNNLDARPKITRITIATITMATIPAIDKPEVDSSLAAAPPSVLAALGSPSLM
ncbi:hypothetical protein D3C85_1246650 [compost metagenome]